MVKRFMCIKVLHEDGEHATPTHVRVVTEIDYDALAARRTEAEQLLADANARGDMLQLRLAEAERKLKQYRDDMTYRMLGGDDAARDRATDSADEVQR